MTDLPVTNDAERGVSELSMCRGDVRRSGGRSGSRGRLHQECGHERARADQGASEHQGTTSTETYDHTSPFGTRLLLRYRRNPRARTAVGALRQLSSTEAIPEAMGQKCRRKRRDAEGMPALFTPPVVSARGEELGTQSKRNDDDRN